MYVNDATPRVRNCVSYRRRWIIRSGGCRSRLEIRSGRRQRDAIENRRHIASHEIRIANSIGGDAVGGAAQQQRVDDVDDPPRPE